ncbi:MAG TPA: hypothetical protein DCP20_03555, partial [Coriobacteriia bacterium]|nr:hypothetical protein [Coriobacteriia bacterium]
MRSKLDALSGRGQEWGPLRIGGEFEIAPQLLSEPLVPLNVLPGAGYYATGRAALTDILVAVQCSRPGDTVLVPDYVCASVYQAVVGAGLSPVQYQVASDLSVDVDALVSLAREHRGSVVAVLLVDYFGLSDCDLWAAEFKYECPCVPVIRDSVQALFEMDRRGADDFRFSSLRKWLPTPDGAPIVVGDGSVLRPTE